MCTALYCTVLYCTVQIVLYSPYRSSIERNYLNVPITWALDMVAYTVLLTVWTTLSDVFTQKLSHREQGVYITSHHSMHMIVTSFSFTLTNIHTNTPSTQSVHVLLKLTMDESDMPNKKLWGKPHCLLRNHLCQRQRQKTCPIKYGRSTPRVFIFTFSHISTRTFY